MGRREEGTVGGLVASVHLTELGGWRVLVELSSCCRIEEADIVGTETRGL